MLSTSPSGDSTDDVSDIRSDFTVALYFDIKWTQVQDIAATSPALETEEEVEAQLEAMCQPERTAFDTLMQSARDDTVNEADVCDLLVRHCCGALVLVIDDVETERREEKCAREICEIVWLGKERRMMLSIQRGLGSDDIKCDGWRIPTLKRRLCEWLATYLDTMCPLMRREMPPTSHAHHILALWKTALQLQDVDDIWTECYVKRGWREPAPGEDGTENSVVMGPPHGRNDSASVFVPRRLVESDVADIEGGTAEDQDGTAQETGSETTVRSKRRVEDESPLTERDRTRTRLELPDFLKFRMRKP